MLAVSTLATMASVDDKRDLVSRKRARETEEVKQHTTAQLVSVDHSAFLEKFRRDLRPSHRLQVVWFAGVRS